ncbi:MAG: hypothetical protein J2P17_18060, partial [Mycobacterium sp.]|nr:hypothetical protein [Mycobacterium sp.]
MLTAIVMGIAGYGYYLDAQDIPNNFLWYAVAAYAIELIVFGRELAFLGIVIVPILAMVLYMPSDHASDTILAMRGVEQQAVVGDTVAHRLDHCLGQVAVGGGKYGPAVANPLFDLDGHRIYGAVPGHTPTHDYREGEHIVVLVDPDHRVCAHAKREVDVGQYYVLPTITTAITFAACLLIAGTYRTILRDKYRIRFRDAQGEDALQNYERNQADEVLAVNLAGRMHGRQFRSLPLMVFFGVGVLFIMVGC